MGTKVDFLYLSEPDMVKAGVKDMKQCVEVMERLLVTLNKGDYDGRKEPQFPRLYDYVPR